MAEFLLFDIGATKTRLAVSKDQKTLGQSIIFPTPQNFLGGMRKIASMLPSLYSGKFIGAAGGVSGSLDRNRSKLHRATFLPGWNKQPLKQELQKMLGTKNVALFNDTAIVGLGEAAYGSGKGYQNIIYYTVSTGVNGVWVVNKKIVPSTLGFETGFQILDESGNTLIGQISGGSIKKRFQKNPEQISDKRIWKKVTDTLATGLYNSILHWSCEAIILGGSVMKKISIADVRARVDKLMKIFPEVPEFKTAKLGDKGGLYGALYYLQHDKK